MKTELTPAQTPLLPNPFKTVLMPVMSRHGAGVHKMSKWLHWLLWWRQPDQPAWWAPVGRVGKTIVIYFIEQKTNKIIFYSQFGVPEMKQLIDDLQKNVDLIEMVENMK